MASAAQASGADALGLIDLIVAAARNATMHRKNCEQLAGHVRMIGNLLETLKSTDLMSLSATREPLDLLEEALRRALDLVDGCREKSYLYMLAMGWNVVYQFRRIQNEIDRYLKLVPLITLVHEYRMQLHQNLEDCLQAIEEDHQEYSLDNEDMKVQDAILKRHRTKKEANILENSLSRRYPELQFHEALEEEKKKLHVELHCSQVNNEQKECQVIEHLIEVTENVVNVPTGKKLSPDVQTYAGYRCGTNSSLGANDLKPDGQGKSEWQADLFDCWKEPCLSLKACFYPCGIFVNIAALLSEGKISRGHTCNDLMVYSLFCCCCCYTCCTRGKLRRLFNIEGGTCDDFLTHLLCCCCAMVQEWHELELRGFEGCKERKLIPPPNQYMKS
ncbi:protein MID1-COMPLEMENTING ACTIVITY 1-like [Diospyros lotus]|uniref:protein MID1-COMPLEMENTING ACTIVITY 1-like n=1 Tax=Diospyros lotus TaxID=55363 RepID=UPI00224D75DB|nr:protein MID1-COMPLEMENTING ACTIVITY 1-like [Diospyros lotus]